MSSPEEDPEDLPEAEEEEEREEEEEEEGEGEEEEEGGEEEEEDFSGFSGSDFSLSDALSSDDLEEEDGENGEETSNGKAEESDDETGLKPPGKRRRTPMRREKSTNLAKYGILTREDILLRQREAMSRITTVTAVVPSVARKLLCNYNWDAELCLEKWSEDPEGVVAAVLGVAEDGGGSETAEAQVQAPEQGEESLCRICYDDEVPEDELVSLKCGHSFCEDCWRAYLALQVKEKSADIICPGQLANGTDKCKFVVDEDMVMALLSPEDKTRYGTVLVESFVLDNSRVKWCPGAGCGRAVILEQPTIERNEHIRCDCGHVFCFRCNFEGAHEPATCDMAQNWLEKTTGRDDTLSEREILKTTKPCPRCRTPIEKNGLSLLFDPVLPECLWS
jgi:ariadne-1